MQEFVKKDFIQSKTVNRIEKMIEKSKEEMYNLQSYINLGKQSCYDEKTNEEAWEDIPKYIIEKKKYKLKRIKKEIEDKIILLNNISLLIYNLSVDVVTMTKLNKLNKILLDINMYANHNKAKK